jgi:hypothetical protein
MRTPANGGTRPPDGSNEAMRWLTLPRNATIGMMAFGAAGLFLAAVLLVGLVRLAATAGALADEQAAIAQLMDAGRATAVDGRSAAERAEAGVTSTADAADQAAAFTTDLAAALRETASSLRVDLFGSRPFAAAADRVDHAADQADQAAAGLTAAATQARQGAAQLHSVTADLDRIAGNMAGIGGGLSSGGGIDATSIGLLEIALIGLVIWLAIPAGVCLWLGVILWRRSVTRPHQSPRQQPVR